LLAAPQPLLRPYAPVAIGTSCHWLPLGHATRRYG